MAEIPTRFIEGFELALPGHSLVLRRLTAADAGPFAAHVENDLERLSEFLGWPATTASVDGASKWLANYELRRDRRVIAVGAWDGPVLLGGAVLFEHNEASGTVELGCWVVASAQGVGVAAGCCRALLGLARSELAAERVEWHSAALNVRSRRLAKRLGFRHEGTLRSAYVLGDRRLDVDVLSLVGSELDETLAG